MNPKTSMTSTDWKVLYRAAIYEKNKSILPQKVSQAEDAVIARLHELFYTPTTREERDDLEAALYCLRAYRSSWEHLKAA